MRVVLRAVRDVGAYGILPYHKLHGCLEREGTLSLGTTAIKLGFSVAGDDLGLATHLVREELQDEVNDGLDGTAARRRGF
jgi:hypothetical protein